jgi:beta-N-acetylhexosaminidase
MMVSVFTNIFLKIHTKALKMLYRDVRIYMHAIKFRFFFFMMLVFSHLTSFARTSQETLYDNIGQKMSLDEKIGQLFLSIIYWEDLNKASREFIDRTHLGNFILFTWSNHLNSPKEVRELTGQLKKYAIEKNKVIPFIAIDQEGGKVSRLKEGFTSFTSSQQLANNFDLSHAYTVALLSGMEMKSVGINLNLAPVVDVCPDPTFWLAARSFGKEPEVVSAYAMQMVKGFHDGGVLCTLKHFPGHGDTRINSHFSLPTIEKNLNELLNFELKPYFALKDETDCIMTAHILFPFLDPLNPATFSKPILTDLLKNSLGFKGIVIGDSLSMKAASPNQKSKEEAIDSISEAAIKAFNAGCDLMILSRLEWADFEKSQLDDLEIIEKVIDNFKKAVREGRISGTKIDDSLTKILKIKSKIDC